MPADNAFRGYSVDSGGGTTPLGSMRGLRETPKAPWISKFGNAAYPARRIRYGVVGSSSSP
jgi:hypothetical protein